MDGKVELCLLFVVRIIINTKAQIYNSTSVNETMMFADDKGAAGNMFGKAVDISDKYIVIGIPGYKVGDMSNAGAVLVFSRMGRLWDNGTRLISPSPLGGALFGSAVALNNDLLIVGSPKYNNSQGIAHMFQHDGSTWNIVYTLQANKTENSFGASVALTSTFAVVGCLGEAAYVFISQDNKWYLHTKLVASDSKMNDKFGFCVTAFGEYIGIGAYSHYTDLKRHAGVVYVFSRNGATWSEMPKVVHKNPSLYDNFGYSIDIYGNHLVVGCIYCNDHGEVFVFKRHPNDSWIEEQRLFLSDGKSDDRFGSSVSIGLDTLVVGAADRTYAEAAFIFRRINGTWHERNKLRHNRSASDKFGTSVAIYDQVVVVGCPGCSNTSGSAFLYDFTPPPLPKEFTIECHPLFVIGYYHKEYFKADEIYLSLKDPTCNNFNLNGTHAWIKASFDNCGSTISEDENTITQKNTVYVKHTTYRTNITVTEIIYQYDMLCLFPRRYNVSSGSGYNYTVPNAKKKEITSESTFSFAMNIYNSIEFLQKSVGPISVSSGEPIYVGIDALNETNIKFAVEECFATPSVRTDGISDVFFHKKCPVDSTFKVIVSPSVYQFRFVINAFRFIQVSGSVYFHCRLNICKTNSTSNLCEQACSVSDRKRRGLPSQSSDESKAIYYISSKRVVFKKKGSCSDKICPANSKCYELFPATCRCNPGFIFISNNSICSNTRVFHVANTLRLHLLWHDNYKETTTFEFHKLAIMIEKTLKEMFVEMNITGIVGVKVTHFRKGSVIVDYSVKYEKTYTSERVYSDLIQSLDKNSMSVTSAFSKINIVSESVIIVPEKMNRSPQTHASLVVTISVVVAALLCVFLGP